MSNGVMSTPGVDAIVGDNIKVDIVVVDTLVSVETFILLFLKAACFPKRHFYKPPPPPLKNGNRLLYWAPKEVCKKTRQKSYTPSVYMTTPPAKPQPCPRPRPLLSTPKGTPKNSYPTLHALPCPLQSTLNS